MKFMGKRAARVQGAFSIGNTWSSNAVLGAATQAGGLHCIHSGLGAAVVLLLLSFCTPAALGPTENNVTCNAFLASVFCVGFFYVATFPMNNTTKVNVSHQTDVIGFGKCYIVN